MFVIILVTSLVTILVLIISSATYLITLLADDADDVGNLDSLGINAQDFTLTPVGSPIDQTQAGGGSSGNQNERCICRKEFSIDEEIAPLEGAKQEDLDSAMMNTKLLQAGQKQRLPQSVARNESTSSLESSAADLNNSQTASDTGLSSWETSASAQKSLITSQLGVSAGKQLFDDFDPKEMQLGGTGLHWCKSRKSLDKLFKLGLPIEIVNSRRETALHVAIRRNKLQVLIGLLNQGANIEARNENGETPLILACKINDIFACQLLLVFDADFNARDGCGLSARHYAASICDRHKVQQQLPSAAHLILAMLNEIGANRCQKLKSSSRKVEHQHQHQQQGSSKPPKRSPACTDGCSPSGTYNGNSYNRWPNFKKESLYKRHLFTDIIEEKRRQLAASADLHQSNSIKKSRLLCIDGGGLRGVIVCQILIEMQKYLKRPVIDYFDWLGGTSVGGFLACALCQGYPLPQLRRVCFDVKDEVFSGGKPYNSKFIEHVLKRTYGSSTRMSDIKGKKLAVTTVIADRDPCQLRFFRNYQSPNSLLESNGFAPETFNDLSGHSIVFRIPRKTSAASNKQTTAATTTTTATMMPNRDSKLDPTAVNEQDQTRNKVGTALVAQATKKDGSIKRNNSTATITVAGNSSTGRKMEKDKEDSAGSIDQHVIDENEQDPLVWQAVRASAAAPFFFKPYGPFLDGGIISNNPTLDMLTEFQSYQRVRKFLRKRVKRGDKELSAMERSVSLNSEPPSELDAVVSLGTGRGRVIGRQAIVDFSQVAAGFATVFSPVELVRSIRAARELFKKLMQQSCHTEDHILDRAQGWCSSLNIPYFRINPPLATIFSIDDKRDEQLINALWQTKLYMKAVNEQLKELGEFLDQSCPRPRTASDQKQDSSDGVATSVSRSQVTSTSKETS